MSPKQIAVTGLAMVVGGAAVFAATPLGRDVIFHLMPIAWTGEAARLAEALQIKPGAVVADVGAGGGELIVELSRLVTAEGHAYATEKTPEQRRRIQDRAAAAGAAVTVIAAGEQGTNLPDACCDAITMRMVMHHIADPAAFAVDLRRSLRPGGRVGIIDFAPGALPHLADDHGIPADRVIGQFTAAGFEVAARHDDWGGRSYLMVFRVRRPVS